MVAGTSETLTILKIGLCCVHSVILIPDTVLKNEEIILYFFVCTAKNCINLIIVTTAYFKYNN